jgi:hypothetical protein
LLTKLNDYYLIVVRPLEELMVLETISEDARWLYQEFFYLRSGVRITGPQFGALFKCVNTTFTLTSVY